MFGLRKDKLEYEFLPAAIEIEESPPSPLGRIVIWVVFFLFLSVGIWSWAGKVDIVTTAKGKAIPNGNVKVIQPFDQGVITKINIEEGQKVKKGETLIELDPTIKGADLSSLKEEVTIAQLEKEILQAEVNGSVVTANELKVKYKVDENILDLQFNLKDAREQEYAAKKDSLQSVIQQKEKELEQQMITLEKLKNELKVAGINRQVQSEDAVLDDEEDSKRDWLTGEMEEIMLKQDISSQEVIIEGIKESMVEAGRNLEALNQLQQREILNQIMELEKKISIAQNEMKKAQKAYDYQNITSPVDGTISNLATYTIGGVVSPSNPIASIVPQGTPLVIEAKVLNKDIGYIKLGQKARIKLDTYPFQKYGTLKGTITYISPDSIEDEKMGLIYKIKVMTQQNITFNGETKPLSPGMSGDVEVITGKRRIIEFFLSPIIKAAKESITLR